MKCVELEAEQWLDYSGEPMPCYPKAKADAAIAELKDKCQMHDFFWEGCGFAKRGFKNAIAVSESFDDLDAENKELKAKNAQLEDDVAFWKSKAKRGYVKTKHTFHYLVFTETEQYGDIYHKADVDLAMAEKDAVIEHQDYEIDKLREQVDLLQSEFHKEADK